MVSQGLVPKGCMVSGALWATLGTNTESEARRHSAQ